MRRSRLFLFVAGSCLLAPGVLQAQLGGFGDLIRDASDAARSARETVEDARALQCDVQGVCGEVQQSEFFDPVGYESLAVTVFDGTRRFSGTGSENLVRDAFEGRLLQNGYLLAASADVNEVRDQMGRSPQSWTDAELAQIRDFVDGIDAVLVIDIRSADMARCEYRGQPNAGNEATVYLSARWLNVDAGDVPWVASHNASVCEDVSSGTTIFAVALETAAEQLATTLPSRVDGSL